jgi:hypothetical protein
VLVAPDAQQHRLQSQLREGLPQGLRFQRLAAGQPPCGRWPRDGGAAPQDPRGRRAVAPRPSPCPWTRAPPGAGSAPGPRGSRKDSR